MDMTNLEIIPNWHPIFVHFTIALLSVSVVLFVAERFVRKQSWHIQLVTVARWNLWLGSLATIATVIAGIDAFNTVPHGSEVQHLAMLDHRKWALSTAALFLFLAVWSFYTALRGKADFKKGTKLVFVGLMTIAGLMLATTGYKGAELVYRHGLGVISMQKDITGGHNDSHSGHGNNESPQENHDEIPNMEMPDADKSHHDHSTHQH